MLSSLLGADPPRISASGEAVLSPFVRGFLFHNQPATAPNKEWKLVLIVVGLVTHLWNNILRKLDIDDVLSSPSIGPSFSLWALLSVLVFILASNLIPLLPNSRRKDLTIPLVRLPIDFDLITPSSDLLYRLHQAPLALIHTLTHNFLIPPILCRKVRFRL